MAGLPHFTNSKSSINLYEPVFLNQFEVIVSAPAGIALAGTRFNGEPLITQQVKSISGLAVDITPQTQTSQFYKFAERRYAGTPERTDIEFTMDFEVNLDDTNSMVIYKIFRQWSDLIYNPLTGAMGLKRDYTGTIVVSIFNKQGDVFRRITLNNCFLTAALPPMALDYGNGTALYTIQTTWKADYWNDVFL